jgi:hypothetical protein
MDLDDPTLSQAWVSGAHFLEHLPHFSKFPFNNKAWPSLTFLGQEPSELKPMCCLPLVSSSLTNHPSHLPVHGMGQVPQGALRSVYLLGHLGPSWAPVPEGQPGQWMAPNGQCQTGFEYL